MKPKQLSRPTQAVILAGGRGMRLRPLTDTIPKAMIEFHGKVFLEYLIEMLREQGFERVLLLLGYLSEVIRNHFDDGSRWGMKIDYSISPEDNNTGRRIKLAEPHLDPCFLLMYCDNYWPMRMDDMWRQFSDADASAMITIYSNKDGYSRDNVSVDQRGYLTIYDKSRTTPGLQGVEIGYAIMTRSVVDLLPEENVSFEEAVYPQLVEQRRLLTYVTDHRYYSVGSHERLPLTEAFLARQPAIILDRDGVINKKPPQSRYIRTWGEFQWLPGAKEALRLLRKAGYRVIIVSNQSGIARGMMTEKDLTRVHRCIKAEAAEAGGMINAIYYCPHEQDMLFQAQRDFGLDLTRTHFIGSGESGKQATDAAGCPGTLVSGDVSLLDVVRELIR